MKTRIFFTTIFLLVFSPIIINAQAGDTSIWSLQKCIDYALQENIQVRKSYLTNNVNQNNYLQAKATRLPSVQASVGENFNWSKSLPAGNYGNLSESNSTNYSLSASATIFNGFKITNNIKQSATYSEAGRFDSESTKESVSLSIMNAYLQVLYANEIVKSSQNQVKSTTEQLRFASERFNLGAISKSDYLQVKAALASEKLTLANSESQLAISRTNLMQLLELPLNKEFSIVFPDFGNNINQNRAINADSTFQIALKIKPQIKSSALYTQGAVIGEKIARSDYFPRLTATAGLNTGAISSISNNYSTQLGNKINPSIGLTLSIPIFQNLSVKTKVNNAKITISNAELDELNTRNQLRKSIEQSCVDVSSAEKEYEAGYEQYGSATETYQVALEKFNQGLINSVDFLIQKTNLISAESKYLQSKYKLIFSYKTLDFYSGVTISL